MAKFTKEELLAGQVDPGEVTFKDISAFCEDAGIEIEPSFTKSETLKSLVGMVSTLDAIDLPDGGGDTQPEINEVPPIQGEPQIVPTKATGPSLPGFLARRQEQIKREMAATVVNTGHVIPAQYAGEDVPDFIKRRMPADTNTEGGE